MVDATRLTGWIKQGGFGNWISEFEFCNTPKLTLLHTFFAERVFISCIWLISVSLLRTKSKLFRYRYFAVYPIRFQVFNQIGNRRYFQLVAKKKCFPWENAKEVVEGVGTGWFVPETNLAPHSRGCGEILLGKFFLITCSVWRHV